MSIGFYGADGTKGTVTLVNGSRDVVGVGTGWLTDEAVPPSGGFSIKAPDGQIYGIDECSGDGAMKFVEGYRGPNITSGAYYIIPMEAATVKLAVDVSRLLNSGSYSQIAGLSGMAAGDMIAFIGSVWAKRTPTQVLATLLSRFSEEEVASSSTANIGNTATPLVFVSGTNAITSLGAVPTCIRIVRFGGTLTLTHNATSLILRGGKDIVTAAGDTAIFISDGSGNWRCHSYERGNRRVPTKGTWTPTDSSGAALSLVGGNCRFSFDGEICTIWGSITYPSTASGAVVSIGGFPFGVLNEVGARGAFVIGGLDPVSLGFLNAGGDGFSIRSSDLSTVRSNATLSGKTVWFCVSYPVA